MHQKELRNLKQEWLVRLQGRELHCALCSILIETRKDLTADHIIPASKGGPTERENLAPAHSWCNQARGNKTIEDWEKNGYNHLEGLVAAWKRNKTTFNTAKVYKCLKELQR